MCLMGVGWALAVPAMASPETPAAAARSATAPARTMGQLPCAIDHAPRGKVSQVRRNGSDYTEVRLRRLPRVPHADVTGRARPWAVRHGNRPHRPLPVVERAGERVCVPVVGA